MFCENILKGSVYFKPESNKIKQQKKTQEAKKFIDYLNFFFKEDLIPFSEIVDLNKVFILDSKNAVEDEWLKNEYPKKQLKAFLKTVDNLKNRQLEYIKGKIFLYMMRLKLLKLNDEIEKNEFFSSEEKEMLSRIFEIGKKVFHTEIKRFEKDFPDSDKKFKEIFKDNIQNLKEKFLEFDKVDLGDKNYPIRNNYITDQCELMKDSFSNLIKDEIQKIINHVFNEIYKKLLNSPKIRDKMKQIASERFGIEIENTLENNFLGDLFVSVLFSVAGITLRMAVIEGAMAGATAAGLCLIGAEIITGIGALLGIGTLFVMASDFIGIWFRENCFDDIVSIFHKNYLNNISEICNKSNTEFSNKIDTFTKDLLSTKLTKIDLVPKLNYLNTHIKQNNTETKLNFDRIIKNCLENFEEKEDTRKLYIKIFEDLEYRK